MIFTVPGQLAHGLGSASLLAFPLILLLLTPVLLSFVRATTLVVPRLQSPELLDGGAYRFSTEALGQLPGFLVGWSVLVATVLSVAAVASALPAQLHTAWAEVPDHPGIAAIAVATLTVMVGLGRSAGTGLSSVLILMKFIPLLLLAILGSLLASSIGAATDLNSLLGTAAITSELSLRPVSAWSDALILCFFAVSGFEVAAIAGGHSRSGGTGVILAVLGAPLLAGILYTLLQWACLKHIVGLASSPAPLADLGGVLVQSLSHSEVGGATARTVVALVGGISMLGLCTAMLVAAPHFAEEHGLRRPSPSRPGGPPHAPIAAHSIHRGTLGAWPWFPHPG